jgi:hypothetical protein
MDDATLQIADETRADAGPLDKLLPGDGGVGQQSL